MLGWVIRLLMIALVIRVVGGLVQGLVTSAGRRGQAARAPGSGRQRKSTSLVRDPVCGTYIQPSHALSSTAGGTAHYFCSEDCRRTFHQQR